MTKYAVLMLATILTAACAGQGPLETVGTIVTAPIMAPTMFFAARVNGREAFLERARQNHRPLPPINAQSKEKARVTLEQALDRGVVDGGIYWQNDNDEGGYAAGGVTVLPLEGSGNQEICREVLIETVVADRPTDQRVRLYCWAGSGWIEHAPGNH